MKLSAVTAKKMRDYRENRHFPLLPESSVNGELGATHETLALSSLLRGIYVDRNQRSSLPSRIRFYNIVNPELT